LPVVVANRNRFEPDPSGQTKGSQFWGTSFVAGPQGEFLARAADKEDVLVADIDLDAAARTSAAGGRSC